MLFDLIDDPLENRNIARNSFNLHEERGTSDYDLRHRLILNYVYQLPFGPGHHRSGDVANVLKVDVSKLGPIRDGLIKKGMIYSPAHGDIAFTVPLFDEFMVRAIPKFKS